MKISENDLQVFMAAYQEAAIWSSTDFDGNSLFSKLYADFTVSVKAKKRMEVDCLKFMIENHELIKNDLTQAGHDFWLTRNHHGAGFWDGNWPQPDATILTDSGHTFGELDFYTYRKKFFFYND